MRIEDPNKLENSNYSGIESKDIKSTKNLIDARMKSVLEYTNSEHIESKDFKIASSRNINEIGHHKSSQGHTRIVDNTEV